MKPPKPRTLKVEELGDHWRGKTYPGLRLKGQWLEQAGILPNSHVQVSNPQPGVLVVLVSKTEKGVPYS